MLLAAMLAMALAAVAPAFAQDSIVNQQVDQFGVVDDSVCSQVYNIAVQQYNAGDQTAAVGSLATAGASAGAFGTAAAAAIAEANAVNIANAVGIDVNTVNVCLNDFTTIAAEDQYKKTATPKATVYPKKYYYHKDGKKYYVTATASATATSYSKATAYSDGGGYTLPETGGASLLALGAGALLVGGGLLARRIAR